MTNPVEAISNCFPASPVSYKVWVESDSHFIPLMEQDKEKEDMVQDRKTSEQSSITEMRFLVSYS